MKTLAATGVALVLAAMAIAPAHGQSATKPVESLPKCEHHDKRGDCHIHDRQTFIDMSADRPDERTQPHAAQEFREQERLEKLNQNQ